MEVSLGRPTAKIYQFPVRALAAAARNRHSALRIAAAFDAPPSPDIAYGGGWYHDEAIAEERRDRKR